MEQNQQIRQGAKVAIGSLLLPANTTPHRTSFEVIRISYRYDPARDIAAVAYNETFSSVSARHQKTLVRVKLKSGLL